VAIWFLEVLALLWLEVTPLIAGVAGIWSYTILKANNKDLTLEELRRLNDLKPKR
jgi:hypothetical protein